MQAAPARDLLAWSDNSGRRRATAEARTQSILARIPAMEDERDGGFTCAAHTALAPTTGARKASEHHQSILDLWGNQHGNT